MLQSVVVVLFILFVTSVRSLPVCLSSRNVRGPRRILDPVLKPERGKILGPDRLILKIDCPDCPLDEIVDSGSWDTRNTTLIYDLIVPNSAFQELHWKAPRPRHPRSHSRFYPPGPLIGATPFTPSVNIIGAPSFTVDEYLLNDTTGIPVEVPGIVQVVKIPNRLYLNITRVSYINGLCFANGPESTDLINIPVAHVYLLHHADSQLEIVWWELQDVYDFRSDTSEPKMPPLLGRKLFHDDRAWLQPQCDCKTLSDQMTRWLVFGALIIMLLIAGAVFESRVFHSSGQASLCSCEEVKVGSSGDVDDESVDEELEERLERHP